MVLGDYQHADLLGELAQTLKNAKYRVHIETAGTKFPGVLLNGSVDHYVVSPKLQSSGNRRGVRYVPEVLDFFSLQTAATFKFVITNKTADQDIREVDKIVTTHYIPPNRVMLMAEGITPTAVIEGTRRIVYPALERGYGVSSRLHVLVWDDLRGH
jgi:organic radical activating enzyme